MPGVTSGAGPSGFRARSTRVPRMSRVRAVWWVLVVLSGCPVEQTSPPVCQGGVGAPEPLDRAPAVADPILLTPGTLAALTVHGPRSLCASNNTALWVNSEVYSPENLPLEHTHSAPMILDGNLTTTLAFTPTTPGPYHLVVHFEPGLGTVQLNAHVPRERSDVAQFTGAPDAGCRDLVSTGGVWACQSAAGTLIELTDGGFGAAVASTGAAVGPQGLWSWAPDDGGTRVTLFTADGGHLVPAMQAMVGFVQLVAGGVTPSGSALLATDGHAVARCSVGDAGLTVQTTYASTTHTVAPMVPAVPSETELMVATDPPTQAVLISTEGHDGESNHPVRRGEGTRLWLGTDVEVGQWVLFAPGVAQEQWETPPSVSFPRGGPVNSVPYALWRGHPLVLTPKGSELHHFAFDAGCLMNERALWQQSGAVLSVQAR